jgi:hypothetical protein
MPDIIEAGTEFDALNGRGGTDGTPDLNFKYITIKIGMLFKKRWRHMFSREGGPDDQEAAWKQIERPRIVSE